MQVQSKVEANLEFNQVLLRQEAKNFTEVATLTCGGDHSSIFKYFFLSMYMITYQGYWM